MSFPVRNVIFKSRLACNFPPAKRKAIEIENANCDQLNKNVQNVQERPQRREECTKGFCQHDVMKNLQVKDLFTAG